MPISIMVVLLSCDGTVLAVIGPGLIQRGTTDLDQWVGLGPDCHFHELLTSCLSLALTGCLGRELWASSREGATAAGRLMRMPITSTSRAATASTQNNSVCGRLIPKRVSSE